MNRLFLLPVLSLSALAVAACSSPEPDAVEATPETPPVAVSETRAETAGAAAALALGLTRQQLEDADLLSPEPQLTTLGEVDSLVLDAGGQVTGLVIDLAGLDKDVVVPIAQVTSLRRGDDVDLTTTIPQADLQAMPAYVPPAA